MMIINVTKFIPYPTCYSMSSSIIRLISIMRPSSIAVIKLMGRLKTAPRQA